MWEFIAFTALVIGIVAIVRANSCRSAIRSQKDRLEHLAQKLADIQKSSHTAVEEKILRPPPESPAKPSAVEELLKHKTTLAPPPLKPVPEIEPEALDAFEPATENQPPKPLMPRINHNSWAKLEEKLGKEWITWIGAVVLFLAAGLFVKYAFDHKWLGPWARVILGVVAGIAVVAVGECFIRRRMRALGQGLIGTGLAILYVSLYAASGLYHLLPPSAAFALMAIVTVYGMTLAILHDAIAVSFLAMLGGFLTPVLLSTGQDARDALFSYLLLLDIGVLGVAFFKRWRALDVLAFLGTLALFTGWYIRFHNASTYSLMPTMLWMSAFYVVFLVQPFVYHLRLATPIVGERFFLAVTNAMGMFAGAHTVLHPDHKHTLGFITIGMSVSYLILGTLTRRRIKSDERAVFGFIALSIALLTIAVPIHLDFHGVTIAWAVKAPLLLYLAYKYDYFPVRAGCLIPLALAAGRIFTIHWPLHSTAFTPLLNTNFGTAIFVALAGAAYAVMHHLQKKNSTPPDRVLKIATAIASAFLALILIHTELWLYLDLSSREKFLRWSAALIWITGAIGFGTVGVKLRSEHSRISGLVALIIAGFLCTWDYTRGIEYDHFFANGRFLAAVIAILILFAYAAMYRRIWKLCTPEEACLPIPLFAISIFLFAVLTNTETYLYMDSHSNFYAAICLLPLIWAAAAAAYLAIGLKLRSIHLRTTGLGALSVAAVIIAYAYSINARDSYTLFFNSRFSAGLAAVTMAFAHAFIVRKLPRLCNEQERSFAGVLYGTVVSSLFILLNIETYIYFSRYLENQDQAQTSLSVIWGIYATAMLVIGFWQNIRLMRLSALALFGATALKLVIVDMARVQEIYRIVSFFVLGILMIAASYLYHRVEKRLGTAQTPKENPR